MNNENALENLERIFEDNKRIEKGQQIINDCIKENSLSVPLYIIALDIDGSASVRKKGIESKIFLVQQMKALVKEVIGDNARLIDSGTRDEMYILINTADQKEAESLAERIRKNTQSHNFFISKNENKIINLTVSIGIASAPKHGQNSFDLIWAAKHALQKAKETKNSIELAVDFKYENIEEHLDSNQIEMLELLGEYLSRSEQSLLHEALSRLFEKHGGIWYWSIDHWDEYLKMKGA